MLCSVQPRVVQLHLKHTKPSLHPLLLGAEEHPPAWDGHRARMEQGQGHQRALSPPPAQLCEQQARGTSASHSH